MKKQRVKSIYIVAITYIAGIGGPALIVGAGVYTGYRHYATGPCTERAVTGYDDALEGIRKQLGLPFTQPTPPGTLMKTFNWLQNKPNSKSRPSLVTPEQMVQVPVTRSDQPFEHSPNIPMPRPDFDIACAEPPLKIMQGVLYAPQKLPAYCAPIPPSPPLPDPVKKEIVGSAKSVGALMVKMDGDSDEEFWGTGFMIAKNIFATSCHVIHPLVREKDKNAPITIADGYSVAVRFDNPGPPSEFYVGKVVTCSKTDGLDIALLMICDKSNADPNICKAPQNPSPPDALPVYFDDPNLLVGDQTALIGYADLLHFVDEHAKEMYSPDNYSYPQGTDHLQFAMLDWLAYDDQCNAKLDILLDTADTTSGESGAPVIEFPGGAFIPPIPPIPTVPPIRKLPHVNVPYDIVVGVHTCCSAFFVDEEAYNYSDLPHYEDIYKDAPSGTVPPPLPCTRGRRTVMNQDVSTRSILNDPDLCPRLLTNAVKAVDSNGKDATTQLLCYSGKAAQAAGRSGLPAPSSTVQETARAAPVSRK